MVETVSCISPNGYTVYQLPQPAAAPEGWTVHETPGVIGGPYCVAEPPGLEPLGVPRPGYHPYFAPTRRYHWPWIQVRATREEAVRDAHPWTGEGDYVYGVVVPFPLGGFVWYRTGSSSLSEAVTQAQAAMAELAEILGLPFADV